MAAHISELTKKLGKHDLRVEENAGRGLLRAEIRSLHAAVAKAMALEEAMALEGLAHCEQTFQHSLPDYLPTGIPLRQKLLALRQRSQATARTGDPVACYNADPVEDGNFVLFRPTPSEGKGLPIQLGRVLRIVFASKDPYAIIEGWWPVMKAKYGERLNIFGTWLRSSQPRTFESGIGKKRRRDAVGEVTADPVGAIVKMADILLWPLELECGNLGSRFTAQGGKIPMDALLQVHRIVKLDGIDIAFSRRGEVFRDNVHSMATSSRC